MLNILALNTLNIILPFLNSINKKWCLIGTTSLILHGLERESDEIYILVDSEGARKLDQYMGNFKVPVNNFLPDNLLTEINQYEIGGTQVRILSNLRVKISDTWVKLTETIKNLEIFNFNGYRVFIPSLSDQQKISRIFGQEKDIRQAEKILSFIKE